MPKKIIVFGFPHCGTSILKSIIGHIEDVYEICDETDEISDYDILNIKKKYVLCKIPFTQDAIFKKKYSEYIKIFIVRNPLWVFSSLNKRFLHSIPNDHSIKKYTETLEKFDFYQKNLIKDLYLIRYEDMFDNDFEKLREIFNKIGFQYTDDIFENENYKNFHVSYVRNIPENKPENHDHHEYRTYQINQPFKNNNDISKIDLDENQKEMILNNYMIHKIYPEIKTMEL